MFPLFALVLLVALPAVPAAAQAPGGGPKSTDCLAEFSVTTPVNVPAKKPRHIRCVDNDPSCDADPTLGTCQFRVQVCGNVTDPTLPRCAPATVDGYTVENVHPDSDPRHDFDFQALEDAVRESVVGIGFDETNVCAPDIGIRVRLGVNLARGRARFRPGKKKLRTRLDARGGFEDTDKLQMVCIADREANPCDDVTSSWDQIRRHVLTPSCGRGTCHNAVQPLHQLSLAPNAAYTALVGVTPFNTDAAAAGKLRVDPGRPDNSFLVDKLRGKLGPDEGARMPFDSKKLQASRIRMITEWIAAGAPVAGFVTRTGCPGPDAP